MQKIKTLLDLEKLRNSNLICPALYQTVEQHFHLLAEALKDPAVTLDDFSLEQDGYLVILTRDDDYRHLKGVGLPAGLLESWPEYIEVLALEDGSTVYRLAILYDDDFMMFFYLDRELFADDPVFQEFIKDQLAFEGLTLDMIGGDEHGRQAR